MARIAIAGAGISGLTLALRLQQLGVETTLWTDRIPGQIRAGQLLNLVARFEPTLARERASASTTGTSLTSPCSAGT